MASGVIPFQIEQHHHFRWLHRLALIAVTQANFAVYVYTNYDEYFNVTGLVSNNLAVLMAVLSVHLVILEVLVYFYGESNSHYLDLRKRIRSSPDPETSLSSATGQPEVKMLATPAVSQQRNQMFTGSCYQLLQPSLSVHPTVADLNMAATRSPSPPYDVIQRHSTSSLSEPDAAEISGEKLEENPIAAALHLPVTSASAIDVTVKPRCDEETTDNTIMITSDNRKEIKQEARLLFTSCDCLTIWRPRDQSCVTRTIELLHCVYVVVDVVKAVCCLAVLRRLLFYFFLYYWRLSPMNIITVFLSSTAVIVFEVSLTVAIFILQYGQMNSDLCLRPKS